MESLLKEVIPYVKTLTVYCLMNTDLNLNKGVAVGGSYVALTLD
jgi:hypothetical protein